MERERPKFELVTLCPPMMIGPPAHQVYGIANQIESNKFIYDWFFENGSDEPVSELPVKPAPLYLYVDVRVSQFSYLPLFYMTESPFSSPIMVLV